MEAPAISYAFTKTDRNIPSAVSWNFNVHIHVNQFAQFELTRLDMNSNIVPETSRVRYQEVKAAFVDYVSYLYPLTLDPRRTVITHGAGRIIHNHTQMPLLPPSSINGVRVKQGKTRCISDYKV
jgi:hypothetical protein